MDVLILQGSPRKNANSNSLSLSFAKGVEEAGGTVETISVRDINIESCRGCLRCNMLGRCAIRKDDWPIIHDNIIKAKGILFASPIFFHHFPGNFKIVLDRFRCFSKIELTPEKLIYTPRINDKKHLSFLLTLGAPVNDDAKHVLELTSFIARFLGTNSEIVGTLCATNVIVAKQVDMSEDELSVLLPKLGFSSEKAFEYSNIYRSYHEKAHEMGVEMMKKIKSN